MLLLASDLSTSQWPYCQHVATLLSLYRFGHHWALFIHQLFSTLVFYAVVVLTETPDHIMIYMLPFGYSVCVRIVIPVT